MYELGIHEEPASEDQRLAAAIATYRASGDNATANKLEQQRQMLEMTKARPKKKTAKKTHGVVIPGTPEVYRTPKPFPWAQALLVGGAAFGLVYYGAKSGH
jgi:hypothetical protein